MRKLLLALTLALAQATAWAAAVTAAPSIEIAFGDGSVRVLVGDGSVRVLAGDGSVRFLTGDGSVRIVRDGDVETWTMPDFVVSVGNDAIGQFSNFTFAFDSDPWIGFGVSILNLTQSDQGFWFEFGAPYVGGAYDTMSSTLTAAARVSEGSPGTLSDITHDSTTDGVTRLSTTAGDCSPPVLGCFSADGTATLSPVTPTAGLFSSRVAFTLGAAGQAVFAGRTDLFGTGAPVPAPGVLPLVLLALAGLAARPQTRRARPAQ